MTLAEHIQADLRDLAIPEKAAFFPRFFKCGPGEYGEGDKFIGVTVPNQRTIARRYYKEATVEDLQKLLKSPWHEERNTALFIVVYKYQKSKLDSEKERWVTFYLENLDSVNNWDLVDSTASSILGDWLLTRDRRILSTLSNSDKLWHERIAVVATYAFIKAKETAPTYQFARQFLTHKHDLIHKACGWMLREAGKVDPSGLRGFLDECVPVMPRTMLRYALEKFEEDERKVYMKMVRK